MLTRTAFIGLLGVVVLRSGLDMIWLLQAWLGFSVCFLVSALLVMLCTPRPARCMLLLGTAPALSMRLVHPCGQCQARFCGKRSLLLSPHLLSVISISFRLSFWGFVGVGCVPVCQCLIRSFGLVPHSQFLLDLWFGGLQAQLFLGVPSWFGAVAPTFPVLCISPSRCDDLSCFVPCSLASKFRRHMCPPGRLPSSRPSRFCSDPRSGAALRRPSCPARTARARSRSPLPPPAPVDQSSCPLSRVPSRLFCPVPSCPNHSPPFHGWASFSSVRPHVDAHLARELSGDISVD